MGKTLYKLLSDQLGELASSALGPDIYRGVHPNQSGSRIDAHALF